MEKKPTLKTIAQLSGLAIPTVSRALGGASDISDKTKVRVRRIADEIGYIPNRAGVRLRTGRTNVVSLVLSTDYDIMNLTAWLISSVAGGLRDTPFHLVVTPDFPDDDLLKPIKYIVETGSADAIIINRIQPEDPRVAYLMEQKFPFVTHGRTIWADKHAYFDYDNSAFGRNALNALAGRGRERILLIAPPAVQNYSLEMIEGVREAAEKRDVILEVAKDVTSDSHRDEIQAFISDRLQSCVAFDGIISGSANSTMSAIAGLEAVGCEVAKDIDVFSKETVSFLSLFRPGILVEHEDVAKAGTFLARAAVHAARHPELPPLQYLDVPTVKILP